MKAKEIKLAEERYLEFYFEAEMQKENLELIEYTPQEKIDETISTPDRYVSRYHYDSKDMDVYFELCPHCKKPAISAFKRVVIDSALNYLDEKDDERYRRSRRRRVIAFIAVTILIMAGMYYWFFYVLSGARI